MTVTVRLVLAPAEAADPAKYTARAAREARVEQSRVAFSRVVGRSVDARRGAVKVLLTVELFLDDAPPPPPVAFDYPYVGAARPVVIVGAGPAGLFAALRLIESGLRPVILERGRDVSARKRDIAALNRNARLDPESNYAFGEGGAGTFSDGKLFTRSKKRGDCDRALRVLVFHGASEEILYDAQPHIGTDRLPEVIRSVRRTILDAGGEILFGRRADGLAVRGGRVAGVVSGDEVVEGLAVVLAAGHSADDIYRMLAREGVALEPKPFAVGVRAEHPQALIDRIQYRMPERGEYLPAASYRLVAQAGGRGVYSFCMCPGGFMVPAMTAAAESVVNGMSPAARNSPYANSGIVVEVGERDYAPLLPEYGPLAGLELRARLEREARRQAAGSGGAEGFRAPAQRLTDFMAGRRSASLPASSYLPGLVSSRLDEWLPPFISGALRAGFADFGRKMKGYVTGEALIAGVESRTSAPVRIPRDPATLEHPGMPGLYPAGEGAGYAGGIISAALDGERVAEAVAAAVKNR